VNILDFGNWRCSQPQICLFPNKELTSITGNPYHVRSAVRAPDTRLRLNEITGDCTIPLEMISVAF
jgi:hypothetical protein